MRVEKPNPKLSFNGCKLIEQSDNGRTPPGISRLTRSRFLRPQIHSKVGRVLADQVDLLHPLANECAHFGNDRLNCAAPMPPTHLRDDTKAARMIASLGNLDVGKVAGSKPESCRVEVRHVAGSLRNDDKRVLRLISAQNSAKNFSGRGHFV